MKYIKSETEPFGILENKKQDYQICIANNLICDKHFKSKKECEEYIKQKPYDIIINLSFLAVEKAFELKETKERKEQKQ